MQAAAGRTPTLDREMFGELAEELGPDALATLVGLFAERRGVVEELRAATRGFDGIEVARLAHGLKGGAATMAAPRLAELASALEQCGRTRAVSGSRLLTQEIATEFDRVVDEMSGALAEPVRKRRFSPVG